MGESVKKNRKRERESERKKVERKRKRKRLFVVWIMNIEYVGEPIYCSHYKKKNC